MNKLQNFIQTMPTGFLSSKDVAELIKIDRLFPVLVRCGGCRFTCAAQDVEHLLKCIVAGEDYVRDVSLPHGSAERAATWKESCPVTPLSSLPASFTAPKTIEDTGREGIGSSRGTRRAYNPAVGTWTPIPAFETY